VGTECALEGFQRASTTIDTVRDKTLSLLSVYCGVHLELGVMVEWCVLLTRSVLTEAKSGKQRR
jgi:hypothetical protein